MSENKDLLGGKNENMRNSWPKQLVQLLHSPLQHVSFAEVLTQRHIRQLSLFSLNFQ